MIRGLEAVMLSSENAKALAEFYRDKVGLEIEEEFEGENEEAGFNMKVSGTGFYINSHHKVKGKSAQPERIILNLEVDDIEKEAPRLKEAGINCVQETYHVEGYGLIATFEDLDGNYFQLVQVRANE